MRAWTVKIALLGVGAAGAGAGEAVPGAEAAGGEGAAAGFAWCDWDRDGALDALVLRAGEPLRLLARGPAGGHADAIARAGLEELEGVRRAAWSDFDGDGWDDLLLVAPSGTSRLLRNEEGLFAQAPASALLAGARDAAWIDHDLDGRPDLLVATAERERLWRNLGGGRFEEVPLELPAVAGPPSSGASAPLSTGGIAPGPNASPAAAAGICAGTLMDSGLGGCLEASSVPALGELYPLSVDLNVDLAGNVGVGTAAPSSKLHVVGDVRATGRLMSNASSGPPLSVASSTLVPSLNADMLDGLHASAFSQLGASISTAEIEDLAVTTAKIANAAVTAAKIAVGAVGSAQIADGTVTSLDLANGAVTSAKIFLGAVSSPQILDGSVTATDLGPSSVTTVHIVDGTITAADIGPLSGPGSSSGVLGVTATGSFGSALVANTTSASGTVVSLRGTTASTSGRGVQGEATSTSGTNYGVYGVSSSSSGRGVYGVATAGSGSAYGTEGHTKSISGAGVYGYVDATTGGGIGVLGENRGNNNGAGVRGVSLFGNGTADGVRGGTDASTGYAVWGVASVSGARGVVGQAVTGSSAVHASGDMTATGAKSFVQPHPTDAGREVRFVCLEGNEAGTYFRGAAQLVGGRAEIEVPEDFRLVSSASGITVQLTPRGPGRLWVESSDLQRVVVRGDLDVPFDYLVQSQRRGFEGWQALRPNASFVPRFRGVPFGADLPEELRMDLVRNGILRPDFTPDEGTAAANGWILQEPTEAERAMLAPRAR